MHHPNPVNDKRHKPSNTKRAAALSVAVATIICLSACGIKGELKRPSPIFDKNKTQTTNMQTPLKTQQQAPAPTAQASNSGKA